jgi:alanine racemase
MRYSSSLEVNLSLLGENFELIQQIAPKAKIIPMVKADAYGNGLLEISRFLVQDCEAKTLGCASLGEAIAIEELSRSSGTKLLVFSDTSINDEELSKAYMGSNIIPVIHRRSDLELVLKYSNFSKIPLVIKVNTGMNRLGLSIEDLDANLPILKARGIKHLMTHFARSFDKLRKDDKTHRQYEEFKKIQKYLNDSGVSVEETSVSNSGAIEQKFGIDETYVRPGLMLYGPPSVVDPILWNGHQVSRWSTKVLSSFLVKKGTPVGYGVNVADKDCFMVVLPIGYGDGFLTYYSGMTVKVNGIVGRVFGRVNMDMTFLQFDPEASSEINDGDLVEIWNHENTRIADIASQAKTHAYQIMCAVSSRIPRIYKVK